MTTKWGSRAVPWCEPSLRSWTAGRKAVVGAEEALPWTERRLRTVWGPTRAHRDRQEDGAVMAPAVLSSQVPRGLRTEL